MELKNDGKSLWVVNKTGQLLTIEVTLNNGQKSTLKLAKTWVPQDLSMQTRAKDIKSSPDYRRAKTMGLIAEQDTDQVITMFSTNSEAMAEYKRVLNMNSTIQESVLNKPKAQSIEVVDTERGATAEEILVTVIYGKPDEASVKNEIRTQHAAGKLTPEGILALATRANELNYKSVIELLKTYA